MFSSQGSQVSNDANYIEDVFSPYLYTGNGSTQTITNNIDLSTKGGLVWIKDRNSGAKGHALFDTARGINKKLQSQSTNGEFSSANQLTAFNTTGFDLGSDSDPNGSGTTYTSWTFRKQPKFFDVVTYTGNGVAGRTVAHNLGSVPGCIIIKGVSSSGGHWITYHKDVGNTAALKLNSTAAPETFAYFNNTSPTSTNFTVGSIGDVNGDGITYVAYLFAHNAGGFGLTGTDNVISCGSFTTDGSGQATVSLGYEPQWLMIKNTTGTPDSWIMQDVMRSWPNAGSTTPNNNTGSKRLWANLSDAETQYGNSQPSATGFFASGLDTTKNYIYIAIRRGPMKVPTDGTKVFTPNAWAGTGSPTIVPAGFPIDMVWVRNRSASGGIGGDGYDFDRLRGANNALVLNSTASEDTSWGAGYDYLDNNTGFGVAAGAFFNNSGTNYIDWMFRRAPNFFDVVCFTGTGGVQAADHNLGVAPELIILKSRSANVNSGWTTYAAPLGATNVVRINTVSAAGLSSGWNSQTPTATQFFMNGYNAAGVTFVAYLFATCAGVSKVGSYTGTGTTLQVNCGFTAGARFVLIKRTDSTGDWYVWDTARGIVSGNDPYLLLNSTAAEVTTTDYVDAYSSGFEISSTAPAAINASGGTFIYLAIA